MRAANWRWVAFPCSWIWIVEGMMSKLFVSVTNVVGEGIRQRG